MPGALGQFSDGQSAASHQVHVAFSDDGLIISFADGRRNSWAYEGLRSTHPVHPQEIVLISNINAASQRLQVNVSAPGWGAGEFATQLISRAPQLSRRAAGWRLFFPMAAATLLVVLAGLWLVFGNVHLAQTMARWIPHSARVHMGNQIIAQLAPAAKLCHSEAGDAALKALTERLNKDAVHGRFTVKVARLGVINAFAAPGENIIISSKLIEFAKSPDEVAGVLAHEMGHGIEIHPEAGIIRSVGISTAISVLLGGASDSFASFGAMLLQMNYSRKAEREADTHALRILRSARIAPEPLAEFFSRIDKKMKLKAGNFGRTVMRILSTHPATGERVEMIADETAWASSPSMSDAHWQALRKICD